MEPSGFRLARDRTPPRPTERAGVKAIEAIFSFETAIGPCHGVVRLVEEAGAPAPGP
jgi:putative flavoprotein involved in K+ transport